MIRQMIVGLFVVASALAAQAKDAKPVKPKKAPAAPVAPVYQAGQMNAGDVFTAAHDFLFKPGGVAEFAGKQTECFLAPIAVVQKGTEVFMRAGNQYTVVSKQGSKHYLANVNDPKKPVLVLRCQSTVATAHFADEPFEESYPYKGPAPKHFAAVNEKKAIVAVLKGHLDLTSEAQPPPAPTPKPTPVLKHIEIDYQAPAEEQAPRTYDI